MAKLKVTRELAAKMLFGDEPIIIVGAMFDPAYRTLVLEISGPGVPDVEEVIAEISEEHSEAHFEGESRPRRLKRRRVIFKPLEVPEPA